MSQMTRPSRHRIRHSNPGGLRPSSLLLSHRGPHNIESLRVSREKKHLVSMKLKGQSGARTLDLRLSPTVLTTAPGCLEPITEIVCVFVSCSPGGAPPNVVCLMRLQRRVFLQNLGYFL